jgi:hypothetical protein
VIQVEVDRYTKDRAAATKQETAKSSFIDNFNPKDLLERLKQAFPIVSVGEKEIVEQDYFVDDSGMSPRYYQQNAIKVQNPIKKQQVWNEINALYSNIQNVSGITHYWGNFASSEADFMQQIINYCSEHKLYYIDAMTTSKSKGFELALRSQVLSSWALSYKQVTNSNLSSYLLKNSNPVLILPFATSEDVANVKKIISLVDRKQFKIVNVSELLNTDLPIIE